MMCHNDSHIEWVNQKSWRGFIVGPDRPRPRNGSPLRGMALKFGAQIPNQQKQRLYMHPAGGQAGLDPSESRQLVMYLHKSAPKLSAMSGAWASTRTPRQCCCALTVSYRATLQLCAAEAVVHTEWPEECLDRLLQRTPRHESLHQEQQYLTAVACPGAAQMVHVDIA